MQIKKSYSNDTTVLVTVIPSADELKLIHRQVLEHLNADHVKVPGFRPGKAPLNLIEKNSNPTEVQSEFLDSAMNQLYVRAIEVEKLRPVDQPKISIQKFVPFTTLEFSAEVEVVGELELADYRHVTITKQTVPVTAKDIDAVITSLQQRAAEKKDVERAAKNGDEVEIDFKGTDPKTNKSISGADGKAYPLILGSNSFIPGFEPELVGLKKDAKKSFLITFPKDYSVSALRSKKVNFAVTVTAIRELTIPKLDDAFVALISPFKTIPELRQDIKKQLTAENDNKSQRAFENELITKIADQSKVAIPKKLVDEQLDRGEAEERQNLTYRGQTWQEHLTEEDVSEEQHRERNRPIAERNVKASLVLSEIAERENFQITPEELEVRLQLLKGQYTDVLMQAELDKSENRQNIVNQMLTEKTFQKLAEYATKTK